MLSTIHLLALALASARHRWRRVFVVATGVCLAAALASCGGGGGGGGGGAGIPPTRECSDGTIIPRNERCSDVENHQSVWDTQLHAASQLQPAATQQERDDEETRIAGLANAAADTEFQAQYGLGAINAQWAYARGATGMNVIIGVVDTGLANHPEYPMSKVDGGSTRLLASYARFQGPSHGTATTGIALASRDGQGVHGVAYGARVRFRAVGLGSGGGPYAPASIAVLASEANEITGWLQPFVDDEIPVVNLSLGIPGLITDATYNPLYFPSSLDASITRFITLLAQAGSNADGRTIFVWAAGNSNDDPCSTSIYNCGSGQLNADVPDVFAGLPYVFPELRGHSLAVAATTQAGEIASFSNRCGALPADWRVQNDGRHYCLSAPGDRINVVNSAGGYGIGGSGTSFAAPHVAGAIAVLIDFFTNDMNTPNNLTDDERNVGNTAIVHRILDTANRTGTYRSSCAGPIIINDDGELECSTYSRIYGAGLLDLKAATEPVDPPVAPTGTTLTGPALPFSGTRLFAGPAYGDAFSRAFASTHIAVFDSMLFPFWHPLTSLVESRSERSLYYHRARFSPLPRFAAHLPGVGTFRLGVRTLPPIPRRAFRPPDATDPPRRQPSSLWFRRETATGAIFAAWRAPDSNPLALRETLPTPLSDDAFTHPFLAFADNGISVGVRTGALTAAAFSDPDAPSPVHGLALDYALWPFLSAQAGMLNEKGAALGLRTDGAFGGLTTTSTAFTGLKLNAPVAPRWRVLAHAHLGTARPDVGGIGLVKEVSPLVASAFSAGVSGHGVLTDGDSLTLAVSQPLRVERGRVSLVVPTGRTPDGDLRRVGVDAGLEPSGREVTLSAAWTAPVGRTAYVRLAAGASREPGHDAAADSAFHALADVSFRF